MGITISEKGEAHESRSIDGNSKYEDKNKIDQQLIETITLNLLVSICPLYM